MSLPSLCLKAFNMLNWSLTDRGGVTHFNLSTLLNQVNYFFLQLIFLTTKPKSSPC